jgi:large subunit ribosomal protein L19
MPFLHHRSKDHWPKPKFKNPRKRASKLLNILQTEAVAKGKESKPEVWEVPFKVGDAVELEVLEDGGVDNVKNKKLEKIRGVVLGRENKGLDTSIYLKDVLFGEHVERKVKLHSPMVKTLKVLEEGFVNKGKKKGKRIKRAKLYYLRDMKPEGKSLLAFRAEHALWHFLTVLMLCSYSCHSYSKVINNGNATEYFLSLNNKLETLMISFLSRPSAWNMLKAILVICICHIDDILL